MIRYRPVRELLIESIRDCRIFSSTDQMIAYIVHHSNSVNGYRVLDESDVVISNESVNDKRIGWKDTHYVCVKRYGDQKYRVPQCIGYCATDFEPPSDLSWRK